MSKWTAQKPDDHGYFVEDSEEELLVSVKTRTLKRTAMATSTRFELEISSRTGTVSTTNWAAVALLWCGWHRIQRTGKMLR